MSPTDFVHISLLALGGTVHGKTALQKKIFFLAVLTHSLDDLGYRPHFYGPHSDDVAEAVQELKTIGYVEQDVRSAGCANTAGFERRRYDYRLTDAGKRVAAVKAHANLDLWSKIQDVAKKLENAGDLDYMKLSNEATT